LPIAAIHLGEAEACVALCAAAVEHCGHAPEDVVLITFYGGQKALLQALLATAGRGLGRVPVVTVDAMQGREAQVIILSCVRTGDGLGFLADPRRICVALSRAREALVVVGDARALSRNRTWVGPRAPPSRPSHVPLVNLDRVYNHSVHDDLTIPLRSMQRASRAGCGAERPAPFPVAPRVHRRGDRRRPRRVGARTAQRRRQRRRQRAAAASRAAAAAATRR